MTLIVILMVVIFVEADRGHRAARPGLHGRHLQAPGGHVAGHRGHRRRCSASSPSAGFEGAASLGEETDNPTRNIPRAILTAVARRGRLLHRRASSPRRWASAPTRPGVKAFGSSSAPLGDLVQGVRRQRRCRTSSTSARWSARSPAAWAPRPPARGSSSRSRATASARAASAQASRRTGAPAGALAVVMTIGLLAVDRAADRRHVGRQRLLLPGHDRRAEPARGLHRHQRRRAALPVHRRPPRAAVADRDPDRSAIAFLGYTIYKNIEGTVVPLRPLPVRGRRVARWSGSRSRSPSRA